jgi:rhodanese-related sulfurtransferase
MERKGKMTHMFQSLFGHAGTTTRQPRPQIAQIGVRELHEQLEAGEAIALVDVRTPAEYEMDGHISGARLLPLAVLAQRQDELPQDRPIVVICRSGNRSQIACEMLARAGLTAMNVSGGMLAWKRAGLPHR